MKCEYLLNPAAIAICIRCGKPYTTPDRDCTQTIEALAVEAQSIETEKKDCGCNTLRDELMRKNLKQQLQRSPRRQK